jgi:hypothetical protein
MEADLLPHLFPRCFLKLRSVIDYLLTFVEYENFVNAVFKAEALLAMMRWTY